MVKMILMYTAQGSSPDHPASRALCLIDGFAARDIFTPTLRVTGPGAKPSCLLCRASLE